MMNRLLLLAVAVFSLAGCANPHLITPVAFQDPLLTQETGRVIFKKAQYVGEYGIDKSKLIMHLISGRAADQDIKYKVYKLIGETLKPIDQFPIFPKEKTFYLDLPVGKHCFIIAQTQRVFFADNLIGKMTTIDINVKPGMTHPIILGIGKLFGGSFYPDTLIFNYQLNPEDIEFCYGLRQQQLSGAERKNKIDAFAKKYFPNLKGNVPFRDAACAIAWMQPAEQPNKSFFTWTKKHANVLQANLAQLSPEEFREKPFDIYKYADL